MINSFFKVLRPGISSTFQDKGRFGLQHLGVSPSGCMDQKSFLIANTLVKNDLDEGVLEFAYQGPLLKLVKGQTKIAITGNVIFKIIYLNKKIINGECFRTYDLKEGDEIDILATQKSAYGYLSIEGGFNLESFYNSISTLTKARIGPNDGKKINTDDIIRLKKNSTIKKNFISCDLDEDSKIIRVLKGPQYNYFSNKSQKIFFSENFKISNLTDRMGMRLEGFFLENIISTNIRSEGITKGAIQVPADGQPIILLTDYPTIGGYPKIANVISADYDVLIQKTPGTNISFKCIDLSEAEKIYHTRNENIFKIINNIKEIK